MHLMLATNNIEPLTPEKVRELLAQGRAARFALEERLRDMRMPTAEQMIARTR